MNKKPEQILTNSGRVKINWGNFQFSCNQNVEIFVRRETPATQAKQNVGVNFAFVSCNALICLKELLNQP